MKAFHVFIVLLLLCQATYGQIKTFYIDDACNERSEKKASYRREVEKTDGGYLVRDYYLTGEIFMNAEWSVYNKYRRICTYYYKNGQKMMEGFFWMGVQTGPWKYWK